MIASTRVNTLRERNKVKANSGGQMKQLTTEIGRITRWTEAESSNGLTAGSTEATLPKIKEMGRVFSYGQTEIKLRVFGKWGSL